MSVGASAAAVAACVEQGATGVLQIDALRDELVLVAKGAGSKTNGATRTNGNGTQRHTGAAGGNSRPPSTPLSI